MIDFTNCKIIPGRAYNGANGKNSGIIRGRNIYAKVSAFCGKKSH